MRARTRTRIMRALEYDDGGVNMRDAWAWRVVYHDDTFLDEYEEGGEDGTIVHGWKDVDMTPGRIAHITLIPRRAHLPPHLLTLPAGSRPIFFRRRTVAANLDGETIVETPVAITCLGWQRTIDGHNVQAYTFFLETGEVIVSDHLDAVVYGGAGQPVVNTTPVPVPTN